MSAAKHTQRRASLDLKSINIILPGHVPVDIGDHDAAALVVWKMDDEERSPECEETARRLVACWNACTGVSTEFLEGRSDAMRPFSCLLPWDKQLDISMSDRETLLVALKNAIAKVEGGAA